MVLMEKSRSYWNGIENLRCWNHLLQNIEYWTKRHAGQKHDWVYYKSQVKSIIQQENKTEAEALFEKCSTDWDYNFRIYFEEYILPKIDSFGRWTLEKYKLYNRFNGLTTNVSEGFNHLLQLLIENEVSIDVAVMCYSQLQIYYWNEIRRGFACTGTYCLKSVFLGLKTNFSNDELRKCVSTDEFSG